MKIKVVVSNFIFATSLFFVCFYVAWQISSASNFLYSTWYEVLALDETIERYAPENKYRKGFENTDKQQHVRLFSGIVKAIQNNGEGLEQLEYLDKVSNQKHLLLTLDEVVHLRDVSKLVTSFSYIGFISLVIAILIFLLMRLRGINVSRLRNQLLGGLAVVITITISIFIIGPTKIFYWAHEVIFPNDHPWFFYYEDSLMSTMMKAPALFGPIACMLVVATVLIWILFLYGVQKIKTA